jgi:hypothetical protein
VSRDEYDATLRAIGHFRGAIIHQANDRWRGECECGYVSTTRTSAKLALEAVVHHRNKSLEFYRANGRVLPIAGAART